MKSRTTKLLAIITMGCLLLAFSSMNLWAEDEAKFSGSVEVGVFSQYIFRGFELSKDSVVIQPSITAGYKGFSFNVWGNLDSDYYAEDESQYNETDLTLSYDRSFGIVNLGIGYMYYILKDIDDSQEVYFRTGLDTLLLPTLTVYREIAYQPAWYFSFEISHSFELPKGITLDLAGSVEYYVSDDDDFVEIDDNLNKTTEKYRAFHNGLVSVGLTIPVGEYVEVVPMIAYSFPLSDDADNLIEYESFSDRSDFFYGGITLGIYF